MCPRDLGWDLADLVMLPGITTVKYNSYLKYYKFKIIKLICDIASYFISKNYCKFI